MTSTLSTALITQEAVRKTLDNFLYTSQKPSPSPLVGLTVVQDALADPAMPLSLDTQDFALNWLLTHCISDQYARQRRALGLDDSENFATQSQASVKIAADAHNDSTELLGWSWLYYHYVRVDLNISAELFCKCVHIDRRTLRRYQQHGLKRLTGCLIEREWLARTARKPSPDLQKV